MIKPDLINGLYELLAAPFMLFSMIKLYKDKQVKGQVKSRNKAWKRGKKQTFFFAEIYQRFL